MNNSDFLETRLRQYLLGHLSESEEKSLEEELMDDDLLFQEAGSLVEVVEDELVQDYLNHDLEESERRSFEERFLGSPRIREKLLLEKALCQRAEKTRLDSRRRAKPAEVHWLRSWMGTFIQPAPALAASLFLLLLGGGYWAAVKIGSLGDQLEQSTAQRALLAEQNESLESRLSNERRRSDRLVSALESANARSTSLESSLEGLRDRLASPIVSALLKPGLYRGTGSVGVIELSEEHRLVELRLDLGIDDYPTYRAALCNAAGDEITVQNRLNAVHEGEEVHVVVQYPSSVVSPGQYHVRLSGVTRAGEVEQLDLYHFRVESQ